MSTIFPLFTRSLPVIRLGTRPSLLDSSLAESESSEISSTLTPAPGFRLKISISPQHFLVLLPTVFYNKNSVAFTAPSRQTLPRFLARTAFYKTWHFSTSSPLVPSHLVKFSSMAPRMFSPPRRNPCTEPSTNESTSFRYPRPCTHWHELGFLPGFAQNSLERHLPTTDLKEGWRRPVQTLS